MSWKNHLLPASYKGFGFKVLDDKFAGGKSLSIHSYPYVDGDHVEDMGRTARKISLNIILYGNDYERRLQKLIPLLEEQGAGELVHPVYGSMLNMIIADFEASHVPDEEDCCRISVSFVEDIPNAPFFDRSLSLGFADKLADMADKLKNSGFSNLESLLNSIEDYQNKINNIAYVVTSTLSYGANLVGAVVSAGLDLINTPRTIIADISAIFGRISTIGGWSKNSTVSDWRGVVKNTQSVIAVPEQFNSGQITSGTGQAIIQQPIDEESLSQIEIWVDLNAAGELAQNASDIFVDELEEPTLTPIEVESIVSDVRDCIQHTIEKIRNTDSYPNAPQTIDQLRDLALTLQQQAEAVIEQRPPLVKKTVEANANLHLIAFRWYGDFSRADELLRLNPDIKYPSFIERGRVLNAYAK